MKVKKFVKKFIKRDQMILVKDDTGNSWYRTAGFIRDDSLFDNFKVLEVKTTYDRDCKDLLVLVVEEKECY